MILVASALLAGVDRFHLGGGLRIRHGRIADVFPSARAVQRARRPWERVLDLGDGVLAPGLVNAHAHLELGPMAGRLPRGGPFFEWVRALLDVRRGLREPDFERGVREGAAALLATGTTSVGDIDSSGAAGRTRTLLRTVRYREILDGWNPRRTKDVLGRVRRGLRGSRLHREGLSPHAPYSTSDELLAGAASLVRRRARPVTVHWAETREEADWLERGVGPAAELLGTPSPRKSGLELLSRAGLLTETTSLVHGNHPGEGEPERLARAGVTLVHCPGTHRFFGRPPFPAARYRRAGVALALGTDSLASNDELDMRREMALARSSLGLSPGEVWSMATAGSARALGLAGRVGELSPGAEADLCLFDLPARDRKGVLDGLTAGAGAVAGVWVAGRLLHSTESNPAIADHPSRTLEGRARRGRPAGS